MNRALSISLLILILAHVAGFYVYFVFRLNEIKLEMRAALKNYPEEKLQRLVMTATQYDQAKNDEGEVKWKGFMYDVARVISQGDQRIVLALRDEAETSLLAFLNKVVELSHQDERIPSDSLTAFSSLLFILPQARESSNFSILHQLQHTPFFQIQSTQPTPDVESPPPRG